MLRRIVLIPDGDPADPSAFSGITHFLTTALAARCHDVGIRLLVVDTSRVMPTESLLRDLDPRDAAAAHVASLHQRFHLMAEHMRSVIADQTRQGDVLLSMNPLYPYLGAVAVPTLYYVDCSLANFYLHPLHGTVPSLRRHSAVKTLLRRLEGDSLRSCDAVCCFSDAAGRELRSEYRVRRTQIRVVGAGANVQRFPPYLRRKVGQILKILFVGRDFARKGGPVTLQAIRRLNPHTCRLTCVTNPSEAQRYLSTEENVRVLGYQSRAQVMRLMREADVFVAPSAVEPFGMAIVEAMAHSLPVVASRCFAIPEILGRDNPGLIARRTAGALTAVLQRFATNGELYSRVSLSNYLRAHSKYRWLDVADRLIACTLDVATINRRA